MSASGGLADVKMRFTCPHCGADLNEFLRDAYDANRAAFLRGTEPLATVRELENALRQKHGLSILTDGSGKTPVTP